MECTSQTNEMDNIKMDLKLNSARPEWNSFRIVSSDGILNGTKFNFINPILVLITQVCVVASPETKVQSAAVCL
jgi:hypothetical protein